MPDSVSLKSNVAEIGDRALFQFHRDPPIIRRSPDVDKQESPTEKRVALIVDAEQAGQRLDQMLTSARPELSRSKVQRDVRAGRVSVSGHVTCQPSRRLREDEEVIWEIAGKAVLTPCPIRLDLLYEDDQLVVVNKPAGLVVHPGAGTDSPTLVEGLLAERTLPKSDDPARPGIVHRLDKDTSGVILVAKTPAALAHLQRQFAERSVGKSYLAVVGGVINEDEGTIDAPIGRDPTYPRRMSIHAQGKPAQTDFQVLRRVEESTLLLASPRTGRTHQLRVHLRYIGHPVIGDEVYDGRIPADRMFLHAWRLVLRHPHTGEEIRLEAPLPSAFPAYHYEDLPWQRIPEPTAE